MPSPRFALLALLGIASAGCTPRSGAPIAEGTVLAARNEAGELVTLRVESVARDPKDADNDVFLYDLSVKPAGGDWRPYCLPDREGLHFAIPLQGTWDAHRNHVANDSITFACTNGSAAKCVRWGYKPWKTVNGVSLADYHQACVHMTSADYCGNGTPHTRDGTKIDLWDRLDIQKRELTEGMRFEAAWSPKGAVFLEKPRFNEPIAELAEACPGQFKSPGAADPADSTSMDVGAIRGRFPDALIFTDSLVLTEKP
jgi:hypothetical protein